MPGFTIRNLLEIEDSAPGFGMSERLEARFATSALECERTGISYQRIRPNQRLPFAHRHAEQEEIYLVVNGSGRMKLGDEVRDIVQWDAIRVAPETVRGSEGGPDGVEIVAFGGPRSGRDAPNDAELLPGW